MVGTFDTNAQADTEEEAELTTRHERQRLVLSSPLTFPPEAGGGAFLYVEQAPMNALHRPTRQRVYRLQRVKGRLVMEVWKFANAAPYVGAGSSDAMRAAMRFSDLQREDGCDVVLERDGEEFRGSVTTPSCPTTINGARYLLSEIRVTPDGWSVLERGVDEKGVEKWGPPDGKSYDFRRQASPW